MLVTRAGLSPVMVGRARERARLEALVPPTGRTQGSAEEGTRVVLIRGEAGVGKTRLIEELISGLPPSIPVLAARAEQGAMGRPYELLLDAVAPLTAGWTRVPSALRNWEDALGVLLAPVLGTLAAADRGYGADEIPRAAIELVRHLTGGGAVVVVFEDLHWADAESLGLFQRLAVTPGLPALLVGSYRPEDLDRGHVTDLIAAVERQRQVDHVVLDRLSVEEVSALVAAVRGDVPTYATGAALHRRTGGNPFFLEELLVAAGDAPVESLADLPLPVNLTEAVLRHLDTLEAEQRPVVDAAAILGQRIPFDLLAAVTGLSEGSLIEHLRDLVGKGLVVEDDADVFSFRHALTREAIASRLLARERRRLHEKCLAALQESGSDDWAAIAHHAAGAGRWEEMVAAARTGARLYLHTGATYQALRLIELALEQADADIELLELGTQAAWYVGLPASALERAEQWRRLAAESGDQVSTSRALRVLARLRWESDDPEGHAAAVEAARAVAENLPGCEERAWVANLVAESAMLRGRGAEAVRWADEALEMAGSDLSPQLRAAVLVNRGSALVMLADREDEGEAVLLDGLAASLEVKDYMSALRAINNLAHAVFPVWEPARSSALIDQMADLVERSGRQDWAPTLASLRVVFLAHVAGDLPAARSGISAGSRAAYPNWVRMIPLITAELASEAGEFDEAAAILAPIADADTGGSSTFLRAKAHGFRARIAARRDPATVEAQLELFAAELVAIDIGEESLSDDWHHAAVLATRAGVSSARVAELTTLAGPSVRPAGGRSNDPAWPQHLRAAVAEADGRYADAVADYQAAAAPPGWRRSPPVAADARMGASRSLLALGRVEEAKREAAQAAELLERWPGWRRDDAEALLRRLGVTSVEVADGSLTRREREVADLVAEGLTNGEIAARLFISTKTASVHVSNILRKLGMATRVEVAAWVVRDRVGGSPVR